LALANVDSTVAQLAPAITGPQRRADDRKVVLIWLSQEAVAAKWSWQLRLCQQCGGLGFAVRAGVCLGRIFFGFRCRRHASCRDANHASIRGRADPGQAVLVEMEPDPERACVGGLALQLASERIRI